MRMLWPRRVLAAALALGAAAGGLLMVGTAHAQTLASGSLSFSGDAGDYISQGKSHSYSTGKGDELKISSATGSTVSISVNAYNGDWWTLEFDAPGTPERPVAGRSAVLVPGTYTAAHRYPFNGTGPGLSLSGDGRGCNELTGSFTINKAVFGPEGYVEAFDATFEQHCEGGTPAARGEVHISNAPAPRAKQTTPASPRAKPTGKPSAAAAAGKPSPTAGKPSATAAGKPSPTPVVVDDTPSPNLAADVQHTSGAGKSVIRAPLLLMVAGVAAWFVFSAVGLVTTGIAMARRR